MLRIIEFAFLHSHIHSVDDTREFIVTSAAC